MLKKKMKISEISHFLTCFFSCYLKYAKDAKDAITFVTSLFSEMYENPLNSI